MHRKSCRCLKKLSNSKAQVAYKRNVPAKQMRQLTSILVAKTRRARQSTEQFCNIVTIKDTSFKCKIRIYSENKLIIMQKKSSANTPKNNRQNIVEFLRSRFTAWLLFEKALHSKTIRH